MIECIFDYFINWINDLVLRNIGIEKRFNCLNFINFIYFCLEFFMGIFRYTMFENRKMYRFFR